MGVGLDIHASKQAAELQKNLAAIVSHDLRGPLSAVLASAERLATARDLPEPRRRMAETIVHAAQRMSRLASDLLDYERVRQGGLSLAPAPVDLADVVRVVADGRDVVVEAEPCPARVDPARIEQLLGNLVENALRHRSPHTRVTLRCRPADEEARVEVHNHGEPIGPHFAERAFEPFRRGETSPGSAGLGLYIAKVLAEAHGGSVSLRSVVNEGTTVTLRLPLRAG